MSLATRYRIAAIVPCHNEEAAVAKVVTDLTAAVPGMTVYVYDNCSTDRTAERAREAGAVVCSEPRKGKGNVVRRAFADIDADIYLLIDGDDTYDAFAAPAMLERLVDENLDQVVGVRRQVEGLDGSAYRPNHELGNKVLNRIVCAIFGDSMGDMLSGYRVFSRRFVRSFPAVSREFEIETELTVHSLALRIPSVTVPVDFRDRAAGSESKLRTYRDGWRILSVILTLTRHERPIYFYGLLSAMFLLASALLGGPVLVQYVETGMVPRFPSLIVSAFLLMIACLYSMVGLIIDGMRKSRHEVSRLSYMRHPAVRGTYVTDPALRADLTARTPEATPIGSLAQAG
jgi:glycosyltransferase involved in cell wall biosynthesis